MDQTVIFPSCQWFKESGLVVSNDGWILYGGPSKSLCVLEPLPPNHGENHKYRALVVPRVQEQKIICLDITPEWPTKRAIITGTTDGSVKQWSLGYVDNRLTVKATHSHEVHRGEKEEVAGVGYCTGTCAITVGCYGTLVKWDINSNIVKNYNALKGFKPTCLKCSPHLSMHIAIGTKQGIVLVLDMSESCKILYKVRAHDEEVYSLSWCPKYEVHLKKALKKNVSSRKKGIKVSENDKNIESTHVELGVEEGSNISSKEVTKEESSNNSSQVDLPEHDGDEIVVQDHSKNSLEIDSSEHDETEIVEDDMFDIYKDHEPDEFGHKKYQSEEILVKIKDEQKKETDYLAECIRLKDDILKRKNVEECSMQSLVDAMDKAHLNENTTDKQHIITNHDQPEIESGNEGSNNENQIPASVHIHRHLIASVGKLGSVRIWSKAGNLVANGSVQKQKGSIVSGTAILWYKPHELLVADGRGALVKCNPIYIDYKNTLEWKFIHHIHVRGLYCIATGMPKKQEFEDDVDWPVWTVGQDRKLVQYSLKENKPFAIHVTCGGFVYNMAACPYDAHRIAMSVGDGAVRVWHASETTDNVIPLTGGEVLTYWQNVLGKVLTVAWHPTQENLLAFGTAESRVGVIDTSGRVERPARALLTALGSGVYALSWVANKLYACGGGQLVCYQPNKPHKAAEKVPVVVEGREWRVSNVLWSERALVVGATDGAVAVLQPHPPHQHRTHAYPFSKLIYTMEWHPLQVSSSSEESVHKNEMAVCSAEKHIVILEFREEDSIPSLAVVRTLEGHRASVNRVCWSPHHEARLLSASNDNTFRVWDTAEGVCISMYVTHDAAALTGIWSPDPAWAHCVLTGGADCCVRVWDTRLHLYDTNAELNEATEKKKKRHRTGRKKTEQEETKEAHESEEDITVANTETKKTKASKKFLLPVMYKQLLSDKIDACRKLFEMHLNKLRETAANGAALPEKVFMNGQTAQKEQKNKTRSYDYDFIKIFGSTNDVNEFLDMEQARHASNGFFEAWIMLALLRGDVAGAVAFAAQRESLSPFLLSLTPCVSYKYWKDTQQLYLAQMEKLSVRGDDERFVAVNWGGLTYKRAVTLLALHEVSAAVELLSGSGLHKEAYALCRARHLASLADGVLRRWADHERFSSHYTAAAACYLALGDVAEAAAVLGRSPLEEHLQLASEMARFCGQNTFAAHVAHKGEKMRLERESNPDLLLPSLPTRGDLLASVIAKSQTNESENDKSPCQSELEQDNVS